MGSTTAAFLYDTLSPLTFSSTFPADDADAEAYEVFRNTITSTAGPSSEIPAADYFSLDVTVTDTASHEPFTTPNARPRHGDANDDASPVSWLRSGRRFRSPMLQLHKEILDFCDFISPTTGEQALRTAAVERVSDVVKYIWPHCKVEVFGSFTTGLYLPTSDIDVVILDSKVRTPQMGLYALARALSQRSITKKMQVIAKARVPIIKFVERQSGIAFDISFDIDSGPKAASFIKDAVNRIPPLRPLCLILKVFLHQRELNEVYSGGIGSYTLLAMLIACLQMHWREQGSQGCKKRVEHNLGILLVSFFDLYGRKLNTMDVGVSCNLRGMFFLKTDKGFVNKERPNLLSVEDPQAADNDIGRNSYNFYKVKSAFSMAYSCLTDTKAIIALGTKRSILGTIIRPDPLLLDRKGGHQGELTFNSLLPGAREPRPQLLRDESDVICNWPFLDDEPLPRDNTSLENDNSSSRKRKSSRSKCKFDRREDIGNPVRRQEENGSVSEKKVKKRKRIFDGLDRHLPYYARHSR
ncbi:LOW QUALITY PROTEIN: terminal nucleotidyltransferase 4B [Dioscorea cayenensis subsp. rotundata]|uniref:polynucleotide adenylyltransferase n=1 Tax=Dioscorea cayennensis subsp. rotundata TaxID=55577 RepID=A0AB40B7F0_DIOCR|nr:LOW QUALITY PROTEIN: terminal nucleotidyltransferase 4B [Dioscorea cayenensis subsp. rotundata]